MPTVYLAKNPIQLDSWEAHEPTELMPFLLEAFPEGWPATARLYHQSVDQPSDVTPCDVVSMARLLALDGPFYVVVYPAGAVTVIQIIAIVALFAIHFLVSSPAVKSPRSFKAGSANNALSSRTNKERINGRIPYIVGRVRSVPDLIQVPYSVFNSHREVETAYMCIGAGSYEITNFDVRDGDTLCANITGTSVNIFAPLTSPNSGSPYVTIGSDIPDGVLKVTRINEVNGQDMLMIGRSGAQTISDDYDVQAYGKKDHRMKFRFFYSSGVGGFQTDSGLGANNVLEKDLTDYFAPGDEVTLASVTDTFSGHTVVLDGDYVVSSVTDSTVILADPALVNSDWTILQTFFPGTQTAFLNTNRGAFTGVRIIRRRWVGPFDVLVKDNETIICNFICPNGLYFHDNQNQFTTNQEITVEVTPIDSGGTPIGGVETFVDSVIGSSTSRTQRALTMRITPTFTGFFRIRARNTTLYQLLVNGSINLTLVGELQWRDAYATSVVPNLHFGDVTTMQVQTIATTDAFRVKERQINALVCRLIPHWNGSIFTGSAASTDGEDIIDFVCKDPVIGNLTTASLDELGFVVAMDAIRIAFDSNEAAAFSYTFDDDNISFEETVQAIANACFCVAYRQGSLIKLNPERMRTDAVMLFNHRNKVPLSETRSIDFGTHDNNDGVEIDYVDPDTDAITTYFIPPDRSARNPRSIEVPGLRSRAKAWWHAWRGYNKILYQNVAVNFQATEEAAICVIQDRILIADNTRTGTQDGEVTAINGLTITASQPVSFPPGHTYHVFLQHTDGTVESIPATAGVSNGIVLGRAPAVALQSNPLGGVPTRYMLVADDDRRANAFLLSEKQPDTKMTYTISAINYSVLYYINDAVTFWFPFFGAPTTVIDEGPFQFEVTTVSIILFTHPIRGPVAEGTNGSSSIDITEPVVATVSYTKSAWIENTSFAGTGNIISSPTGAVEFFRIQPGGSLIGGHDSLFYVSTTWPDNTTFHLATLTYDSSTLVMSLYLDGLLVSSAASVPAASVQGALSCAHGMIGFSDEIMHFARALTDEEVFDLWRTTKI